MPYTNFDTWPIDAMRERVADIDQHIRSLESEKLSLQHLIEDRERQNAGEKKGGQVSA